MTTIRGSKRVSSVLVIGILLGAIGATHANDPHFVIPKVPDAPQPGELQINGTHDPVARACSEMMDKMDRRIGRKPMRTVVTRSKEWGTIWRRDTAFPASKDEPPMLWRTVCWNTPKPGHPLGLYVMDRPLEMFDPSASIQPLK